MDLSIFVAQILGDASKASGALRKLDLQISATTSAKPSVPSSGEDKGVEP